MPLGLCLSVNTDLQLILLYLIFGGTNRFLESDIFGGLIFLGT